MSTTDTPPPPPAAPDSGPRVTSEEVRDLSRLRRTLRSSPERRYVAGVAGGLARHLDIDPVLVRVLLVVLVFFGGSGLIVYGACWLLVPEEGRDDAPIRLDARTRGFGLYAAGIIGALALLGDTLGHWGFPWPLAILTLIVLAVVSQWDRLTAPRSRPSEPEAAAPDAEGDAPASYTPTVVMREPDPRKRGPILFWFTLALIALAEGVLGVVDGAGAHVVGPAYPALALGIVGGMLVVAAFWGRGGGLILLGLVATLVLGASTAAHKARLDDDSHNWNYTPASADSVATDYHMGTGDLMLDLSQVSDPQDLAGRTITIDGHVGRIRVYVPDSIAARGEAHVHGVGHVEVFGDESSGFDDQQERASGSGNALTIRADLNVGDIEIQSAAPKPPAAPSAPSAPAAPSALTDQKG